MRGQYDLPMVTKLSAHGRSGPRERMNTTAAIATKIRRRVVEGWDLLSGGWRGRLYTPTCLTKIGATYFIVDCWHNRVIFSDRLDRPIAGWRTLDTDLAGPHSVASDGEVYLVDDTGRHRVRVYRRTGDRFDRVDSLDDVGTRPHRVIYDAETGTFLVVGSTSQTLTVLKGVGGEPAVRKVVPLDFLGSAYARSVTLTSDGLRVVSDRGVVFELDWDGNDARLRESFELPESLRGLNDVFESGSYVYITSTPRTIVRAQSLGAAVRGDYEDLYARLGFRGTPYYITEVDGCYAVPEIAQFSGIVTFRERGADLEDVRWLHSAGRARIGDVREMNRLPK